MNNIRMNRRRMMVGTAGLMLSSKFLGPTSQALGAMKNDDKHNGFLLGGCDWTLGKRAEPDSFAVAKEIGLDGVQVSLCSDGKMIMNDPDVRNKFVEASQKNEVLFASLALGILNSIPLKGDDPRPEKWISQGIEVAKKLDVEVILMAFFGNGDILDDTEGRDIVIKKLKRLAPQAEQAGVVLGIESWLSAEQHADMLERIGSPAVKVYYDVGNMHKQGYDIYKEIPMLGDRICQIHAKDYHDLYGKGSIDFPAVRKAMDAIDYRGWFVIEGKQFPLGRIKSLRYDADYLREIFPKQLG